MAVRTRSSYGAASVVMTIFTVIAAIIAVGIILVLLGASRDSSAVNWLLNLGHFFAQPFEHLFKERTVKQDYLVNWGIAAIVYLVVGAFIARVVRRA